MGRPAELPRTKQPKTTTTTKTAAKKISKKK